MTSTKPRPEEVISESELREYSRVQRQIMELTVRLNGLEKDEARLGSVLMEKIQLGLPQRGRFEASVEFVPREARPSWKTIALRLAIRLRLSPAALEVQANKEARANAGKRPVVIVQPKLKVVR